MAIIKKIEDIVFGGNHPNGINTGYERRNMSPSISIPVVGENYHFSGLTTSEVTEVYDVTKLGFTFSTLNSVYRVDYG